MSTVASTTATPMTPIVPRDGQPGCDVRDTLRGTDGGWSDSTPVGSGGDAKHQPGQSSVFPDRKTGVAYVGTWDTDGAPG